VNPVVIALCEAAASRWAVGDERRAERIFAAALELCEGREFVDVDEDAR
jgi:hypothetical protein